MIPYDKIKVFNFRKRNESQFALNVQSISWTDQGYRLGQTHIRAEIVTCARKQVYLESLVVLPRIVLSDLAGNS